jgi:predicted PurR-regulated permease PerM
MKERKFYYFAMLALVLLLGYLSYLILRPFLTSIGWAIVFAIVFFPVHNFIVRFVRWNTAAAAITTFFICILILGPFSYFAYLLTSELSSLSVPRTDLSHLSDVVNNPVVKPALQKILRFIGISQTQLQISIAKGLADFGKRFMEYIPLGIGNITSTMVNFGFMVFALFFFLKDGPGFVAKVGQYAPFSAEHKKRLAEQVKNIVISTIYGGIIVAMAQGTIGGIVFTLLALQSPILWGIAIFICSFIPLVGSAIVWVPAVFYLVLKGFFLKALILGIVGVFGIAMVDNVLRPIIIKGRVRMPLLAIFFSVLGGIQVFGLIGLIMGPLVLAVFISVLDIWKDVETS